MAIDRFNNWIGLERESECGVESCGKIVFSNIVKHINSLVQNSCNFGVHIGRGHVLNQ